MVIELETSLGYVDTPHQSKIRGLELRNPPKNMNKSVDCVDESPAPQYTVVQYSVP